MRNTFFVKPLPFSFWLLAMAMTGVTVADLAIAASAVRADTEIIWLSFLASLGWLILAIELVALGGWTFMVVKWIGFPDTFLMTVRQRGAYPYRMAARYLLGAIACLVLSVSTFLILLYSLKVVDQNVAIVAGIAVWLLPILFLIGEQLHYRAVRRHM